MRSVALPEESFLEVERIIRKDMIELNKSLAADPRVEISLVSIGDWITICQHVSWFLIPTLQGDTSLNERIMSVFSFIDVGV